MDYADSLVDLIVPEAERPDAAARAASLTSVRLTPAQYADLECLATGVLSPLGGFMTRADYDAVVDTMRLADGSVWTLPVTLAVDESTAASIREHTSVALQSPQDTLVATLSVEEKYRYDKRREASRCYRTEDANHPGVRRLYAQGDVLLGGPVTFFAAPSTEPFAAHRLTPAGTRRAFADRGWRTTVGFQTRNPIHRAHEYIQKTALEIVDGLLLHPLVGDTKSDDIPAETRMECYRVLIDGYFPKERVVLGVFPAAMRYAGPREAVFHAIARRNYGCTHFIVGRDHAGVGNYYGTYDAQHIFGEFRPEELGITPLFFEHTFFCSRCGGMASPKTCPHDASARVTLSGTELRDMLARGVAPPAEFTRPEVAETLMRALQTGRT